MNILGLLGAIGLSVISSSNVFNQSTNVTNSNVDINFSFTTISDLLGSPTISPLSSYYSYVVFNGNTFDLYKNTNDSTISASLNTTGRVGFKVRFVGYASNKVGTITFQPIMFLGGNRFQEYICKPYLRFNVTGDDPEFNYSYSYYSSYLGNNYSTFQSYLDNTSIVFPNVAGNYIIFPYTFGIDLTNSGGSSVFLTFGGTFTVGFNFEKYYQSDDLDSTFTNGYTEGYDNGYDVGYDYGYDIGYSAGEEIQPQLAQESFDNGYDAGYRQGLNDSEYNPYTFGALFGSVADTPILIVRSLFNFDFFGVNVLTVVLSLFTAFILFYLLRKLF